MKGKRIAILGAARSGLAVAAAAKKLGAIPEVFDQKSLTELASGAAVLGAESIPLHARFAGRLSRRDFDMIVTSPGIDYRDPVLQEAKAESVDVIGEIEFAYRTSKAPIVAITGTNGKSTTTVMTWLCLSELGYRAILCGNIAGSGYPETTLTQAAADSAPDQVLVSEVSSFQLEWVSAFRPRCAAITNIVPDHLKRYESFEDYAATKHRIYRGMGAGDIYVCHNDPMTQPRLPKPEFAVWHTNYDGGHLFLGSRTVVLEGTPIIGRHNIANAALAANLALAFDLTQTRGKIAQEFTNEKVKRVERALRGFHGLSHRMEVVGERDGVRLINNSMCTNPAAVLASSKSLGSMRQHILMGGQGKGLDFSSLGEYFRETGHEIYLYGEDRDRINLELGGRYYVFKTMEEAFRAATDAAEPGDVIMLAPGCASQDQYLDFRARGDEFKEIAKGVATK